jgi:hypothetical protein
MSACRQSLVPLAVLALAAGCGETIISISSDGRIEVFVSTTGTDSDADGFSVTVDGGAARFVAPGGSVVLDRLSEGSHSVLLSGLAENCRVEGSNPRPVVVGPDGRADVAFDVRCGALTQAAGWTAASAVRASRWPASRSTNARMAAPTAKKPMTLRIALRLDPVAAIVPAKISGPKMPANFSNTLKKPKNSPLLCCGIMLAKSDRLSACVPPCTIPTRPAST